MWRTDALELLQEAPDVCSPNCEGIAAILDNAVADGGGHDQVSVGNQTESPSPHEVAGQITGDGASGPSSEINSSLELDAAAVAGVPGSMEEASTVVSELPATKDIQDEAEKIETNDPSQDHDSGVLANCAMSKETESGDQPIQPAKALHNEIINDAATSAITAEVEDTAAANENDPDAVANEVVEEAGLAQAAQSWDDRPIRPAPTAFDASEDADGEVPDAGVDQAALFCDDRPIRPAPVVPDVGDDDNATVEVVAEVEDAVAAEENDTDAVANEVVEEAELAQAAQSWDDRPIRPAPTAFDASVDADGDVQGVEVVQAPPSRDDQQIGPSRRGGGKGENDVTDVDAAVENSAAAHAVSDVKVVKTTQSTGAGEDRPVRSVHARAKEDNNGVPSDFSRVATSDETNMRGSTPTTPHYGATKESVSAFSSVSVESSGAGRLQLSHYSQPMNPFERRYAESETTSGSESGEIALLGGLEDVFDPVDELLPAMAEDIIQEIDNGITGVLSAAASNLVSFGAAGVGAKLDDVNRAAQEKTLFGNTSPSDGISYLQHFGIGRYCEHKQSLVASSDELSQAMYEANQDDSDLVVLTSYGV
ncbi:hypothetical protein ON010_g7541 [Phytophthora cinnamomi]|nr:hypothetical protein ON010_g7541 [Phytophthora cinnamomi]